MRAIQFFAAAVAAVGFPASAIAAQPDNSEGVETQLVSYADLDLASADGQRRIEQRVRAAADGLCREEPGAQPHGGYLDDKCFRAVVADAMGQVQVRVARRASGTSAPLLVSRR